MILLMKKTMISNIYFLVTNLDYIFFFYLYDCYCLSLLSYILESFFRIRVLADYISLIPCCQSCLSIFSSSFMVNICFLPIFVVFVLFFVFVLELKMCFFCTIFFRYF